MFHCAPAQLRLVSRRSRTLPLLTALVTLIFTSAILRRHAALTTNSVLDSVTSRTGHPPTDLTASNKPLLFYGAARHLSDQRRTLEAPPAYGRGATEGATGVSGQHAGLNPGRVTGPDRAEVTGHNTAQVTGHDPAEVTEHDPPQIAGHDRGEATGDDRANVTEPGDVFLRWDKVVPAATEEQQRPLTSEWLWERYQEQRERRETLAAACRKYNVTLVGDAGDNVTLVGDAGGSANDTHGGGTAGDLVEAIKASHMSVVPQLKALVCLVNKVASTSLLGTMLKIAGHGVPVYSQNLSSPHAHAKVLQPEKSGELEAARRDYTKVLLVRHPMDRLISAYEDKVKRAGHKSLLELREAIFAAHEHFFILDKAVELYSKYPDTQDELSKTYYAELADYKREVQQRNHVPTFQEFLDFALSGELTGDSFDSHWTPYWRQCAPCHMNYDVIGKLETGADDFKYVWNLLGIYRTVGIPWLHQQQRPHSALEERLRAYLAPLRTDTVRQLRTLFRPDFDMFGYDWRRVMDVSGHCRAGEACDLE